MYIFNLIDLIINFVLQNYILVAVVIIALIILSAFMNHRRKKANKKTKEILLQQVLQEKEERRLERESRLSDNKEEPANDLTVENLPSEEALTASQVTALGKKIIRSGKNVNQALLQELQQQEKIPLLDVISAYPYLSIEWKQALSELATKERWVLRYSDLMGQSEYAPGVMLYLWRMFGDEELFEPLIEKLSSWNEAVSLDAASFLAAIHEERSIPYLVAALMQPNRYVLARVADVFAAIGPVSSMVLLRILPQITGPAKCNIMKVLPHIGSGYKASDLVPYLRDEDEELRRLTVFALAQTKKEGLEAALSMALEDKSSQVRSAAITVISQFDFPKLRIRIKRLESEEFEKARDAIILGQKGQEEPEEPQKEARLN